ncbi:MAG: hypothetical protein JXN61_08580 [Sedimentisphaerales bacterium]|nr:hypothetical protein [Sedimentisphaerales bacterium]
MKKRFCAAVFFMVWLGGSCFGAITQIWYQSFDVGEGRWQYEYSVQNISLPSPIKEFTIWFDYGAYDNLVIETTGPLTDEWEEVVWQPEPVLLDDGGYDAEALGDGVSVGIDKVGVFVVSFDWLGVGEPGPQLYEIINPVSLETIDSGMTRLIPEPATLLFLAIGGLILKREA